MLVFRIFGSLGLGIFLLAVLILVLAWGTFVESEYGASVAKFVLYANPWFAGLVGLLALNIAASLAAAFPWNRRRIPFLTAHTGILVLLFGCFLTFRYGEESQMTLPEGTIGCVAVKPEKQQFEFRFIPHSAGESPKPVHIPFYPGPFSWQEYDYDYWIANGKRYNPLLWYAMHLGHRSSGKLPIDDPNIKIEVLDYYAHSILEPAPPFELNILWKKTFRSVTELGETKESPRNWEMVRLDWQSAGSPLKNQRGISEIMSQGERISYTLADSREEEAAFHRCLPTESSEDDDSTGLWGEIVLYYSGQRHSIQADQLCELSEEQRFSIPESDLQIGNVRFRERGPLINFTLFTPSGESESMTLLPDNPELCIQARRLGVFGAYWVNSRKIMQQTPQHTDNPMLRRLAIPRIDFMQSPDKKLHYRLWSGQQIIAVGTVPGRTGQAKPKFKIAEGTPDEAEIIIERFVPQDIWGNQMVPAYAVQGTQNEKRVKLRIVFDGTENIFWLRAVAPTVVPLLPEPDQIRYIYGKGRTLCAQLNFENIDLGFGILLKQFEKRTEPGTRMPSHFSSLVDYVEPISGTAPSGTSSRSLNDYRTLPEGKDVLISMNRPGYFGTSGQKYRIYQSSYLGPFYADDRQFYEFYDGTIFPWEDRPRESIAMSTLSINSDPGRGWKYFGSFLIVLGTVMFVWRRSGGDN